MRTALVVAVIVQGTAAVAAPPEDAVLRAVSWCNRGYGSGRPELVKCRGSVEQRHRAGEGIWGFSDYRLASVTYGDLTGDQHEDALVVLEATLRPVIIDPHAAPAGRAEVWLIQRRGTDLVIYTSESAASVPDSVAIANGVVTLVWHAAGQTCVETWKFGGEGRTATKSARQCSATTP